MTSKREIDGTRGADGDEHNRHSSIEQHDGDIIDELGNRVESDKKTRIIWFHALRAEWRGREKCPLRAFRLISGVFFDLYDGLPPPTEVQGFFEQYGLPTYQNIVQSIDVFNGLKPASSLKNMKKFPTYDLNLLVDNLDNFSTNPEILHELNKRLSETTEVLIEWFYALHKAWTFTKPKTPDDASRLVRKVLYKLNDGHLSAFDLQGFLEHYGLPTYWELPEEKTWGF
ncbi:hypothetical protein QVD17_10794 [Tagetes erecta]|uniref:Uncharacterized protein n=1 Tax=Tagetes erecta TaxID=13708 RepID=A0AAD8P6N0_TARER|nr:hypothetical protein QVD17_10794 [Tagetes erecta]